MAVGRQERRVRAALWLAIAVSMLMSLGTLGLFVFGRGLVPPWAVIVAVALLAGGYCWACLPWWRRIDHMERDSWLTAWFWGGGFGGIVAMLSLIALAGPQSLIARGAMLTMVAQAVCHMLFQLGWSYAHRARAS